MQKQLKFISWLEFPGPCSVNLYSTEKIGCDYEFEFSRNPIPVIQALFFFFNLFSVSVDRHPLPYLHALRGVISGGIVAFFVVISVPAFTVSSVQFSCSVVSDSLRLHELQHAGPPCPSPTPTVHSDSCPLSQRW